MMLLFWVVVIAMIVATLALILPALLKPSRTLTTDASAEKRAIFRQQFDEIAQDKTNGVLDAAQYELAKTELERRMLDEIGTAHLSQVSSTDTLPDRRLAWILLILLPIASVLIYSKIGSPASIGIPQTVQNTVENNAMTGNVDQLLGTLKSKLENNPEDGKGWALLAATYVELERYAEAVPAYEKAVNLTPDDPQLLADYADALAVLNNYNLAGKPEELANQALKLNPHNIKALLLAAAAATDRKDYKLAIPHWEQLQKDLPADSNILPKVKSTLVEIYTLTGVKPAATSAKGAAANVAVSGTITITPALAGKLASTDTVFVFARAAQGSPMPLAIIRTTVKDLPYTYHLDDSNSLMPSNKLSQASEVVIVARVSKSGDAKPQAGDLQGTSTAVKPNGGKVDIEINELLK
jgi:cytochrome c-type biogenesis protein CcmH